MGHDGNNSTTYVHGNYDQNDLAQKFDIFLNCWVAQLSLSVIFNVICLYVIVAANKGKRNYSDLFLFGVMTSHLINAASIIIYSRVVHTDMTDALYQIFISSIPLTLTFLTALTIDRYLAVKYSFFYHTLTWKYPVIVFGTIIIFMSFVVLFLVVNSTHVWNYDYQAWLVGVHSLVVAFIIIFCYYNIFCEAKRQLLKIASTSVWGASSEKDRKTTYKNNVNKRKMKAVRTCLLFTMSYFVFWLPYFVFLFLDFFKVLSDVNGNHRFWFQFGSWFFGGLNGLTDPFVYEYFNKDLRMYISERFLKRNRKTPVISETNVSECGF